MNKRGAVSIHARNKMLRLRWSYQGRQFTHSLRLLDTPLNHKLAKKTASEIELDIGLGQFDPTLSKYRHQAPTETESVEIPTANHFEQFIESRRHETSPQAIASRYLPLCNNLKRFGITINSEGVARDFVDCLRERQSPRIANQNLSLLRAFGAWAVQTGAWETNYFEAIKPLKLSHQAIEKRQPFSADEIRQILDVAKTHPRWHSYHDFVMTLLYLGLRPSEAIGLQWKHLDLQRGVITIAESLSRSPDGKTSGYARQRKATKNQKVRIIPLQPKLLAMFQGRWTPDTKPNDLIFKSPKGKPIDDRNFTQRTWKGLCTAANIPYRVTYAARHSLGSHLLESGASIAQVAAILGNRPETVARYYAHAINLPELPSF